jgi:hypothetical protein
MRRPVLALLVAAVLVGACGDDSSSDDRQGYTDALADSFAVEEGSEEFGFTAESADCVAERSVEVIGIDRLQAVGDPAEVTAATGDDLAVFDLAQDELDEISAAFLDCVDNAEQLLRAEFLEGSAVEGEQAECVAALVDRDLLIRILSSGIAGQDPMSQLGDIQDEFEKCA